jgi:TolA-binding protein
MKRILCLLPLLTLIACEGKREDHSRILAKIAGTSYTQNDFEFVLKTMTADRQAEILKDPEARRKQFNFMLKQKLQAMAAQKSKLGKSQSLIGRQDLIDKRIVTQFVYQTHLAENDGMPASELQAYYQANTAKFTDDSGKVKPFEDVRTRIADSLVISKAPLDSFYQANSRRYLQKAFCDLSFIQTANKKSGDEVAKALAGGTSFTEAVDKFSIHTTSKANHGKIGRLVKGETIWELGTNLNADSLFFNETTKLKIGVPSKPVKRDSTYVIVKADSCMEQITPPLEQVRKQVSEDYLSQYKTKLSEGALVNLKAKYGVKLANSDASVSQSELQKFFDGHKDNYLTPETYDVYHIELKNKDQLVKRLKDVKDLEGFKIIASQITENSWTKPEMGHVGIIKRDHCLPDGIGMMPSLFSTLDSISVGLVPGPIQNPDTKKWHYFWLAQKIPKQPKAFDRVLNVVKQDYKTEKVSTVKPGDTLAIYSTNKVILEKDVDFLRLEIPAHMQDRYTRESLVDYLLTWELATTEAKELGLTEDIKLQAQREENKVNYWTQVYQDSIVAKNAGLDSATLKKTFESNRNFFTKDSSEKDYKKFVRDIAAFLAMDIKELDIEYKTNPERYRRDTVALSYEESRYDIFQNVKGAAYTKAEEKLMESLEREFQVVVLDPTLLPAKIKVPQDSYKQAQNLHYDRKLDQAIELYQRLREEFPKNESLQDSICFGMAQIYIEQEKYQQALAEYRRLSYLFPKSTNNYKAMFMVGFIHAEHLKNDSAAVRSFEKMLGQYPSSDLSDDADWMIRNIRSGGKLMPVLEGDSTFVAPDSTAATAQPVEVQKTKPDTTKAATKTK